MAASKRSIIGGVDTHAATHHAAVIDLNGRLLASLNPRFLGCLSRGQRY
jgi:hypothetical protein